MRTLMLLGSCWLACGVACAPDSDVGARCAEMEVPPTDNTASGGAEYPAVVEVNTAFPCDALVCVSTSGRPAYCSSECKSDRGCPSAFECRAVTNIGPLADRSYCVWRPCRAQLECGDVAKYDCLEGNYGPLEPPGLCGPVAEAP